MPILIFIFCILLIGCGSDTEQSNVQPKTDNHSKQPIEQPNMGQITVPDNFDWSTSDEVITQIQLVSAFSEINQEKVHLGGKHFVLIEALDSNMQRINETLTKALSNKTGTLNSAFKLKQEWHGIRVSAWVDDVQCTKDIPISEITEAEEIECDIVAEYDEE